MPTRVSLLMQMSTVPIRGGGQSTHTAGWSESLWAANPVASTDPAIASWATARALLLPSTASVIGFRIANYTFSGNRMIPTGTQTGKMVKPGVRANDTDVPQLALALSITTSQGPNTSRMVIRNVPDSCVSNGEYDPDNLFAANVYALGRNIISNNWRFPGRVLTNPTLNIVSVVGNLVTLTGAIGAVANTSHVRFLNAKNKDGAPIKGEYLVTAAAGNTVTIAGYKGGDMDVPSGKMRIDSLDTYLITSVEVSRICVRKIGRPFENYRGRQSNSR